MNSEVTVAWLGNFGVRPFWDAADYPIWESSDTVRLPHVMNLSQPPTFALKLRYRWGDDTGQFGMVEYTYPDPPPGFQQAFIGLDPPGPGKVELQVQVNVGPTVSGGPDEMYWQLGSTAGDFLGLWYADTNEWHAWPSPPVPTRTWSDELLRAPSATWWCVTAVVPPGGIDGCPPVPRPPWPYGDGYIAAVHASSGRRKEKRRVVGGFRGVTPPPGAPGGGGDSGGDGITH